MIKLIKDWSVQNEVIPPNFDNNKTVSDRKWLAWMLRKHGNGFKHLKKMSKSSMSDIKLDRARYPDNSSDFMDDFYYQCNSNNISTSIERFFSELYNDPFTKRVFASFVYIMPGWTDLDGYDFLTNSEYFAGETILERNKHYYFQCSNNKNILASFDTNILIMANKKYQELHHIGKVLAQIKEGFSGKVLQAIPG